MQQRPTPWREQFRTDQPCTDWLQPLCAATESPTATMLGSAQETWLFDRLQSSLAGTFSPSKS